MTLLDTIRSLLGLDDDRGEARDEWFEDESRGGSDTPDPDASSEAAVKRSQDSSGNGPAAASGDAAGSTESIVDESAEGGAETGEVTGSTSDDEGDLELDHSGSEPAGETDDGDATATNAVTGEGNHGADESAAAGGDAAASTGSMTEETNESLSATEDAEAAGPTDADPAGETDDMAVDALKGIGPSYSETLGEAGIETVSDLAAADPGTLANEIGISESRVERWTERAKARQQ